jgi:hypothetical protein
VELIFYQPITDPNTALIIKPITKRKMRITIRINEEEEAKLKQLQAITGIDNKGSALKFAVDWSLNHIKIVTESLISPNWEVFYQRRSKTNPSQKKLYFR